MDIELLQKRKKQLGLTNQELSRISGVSLDTVSKILSGTANSPEANTIRALWEALDSFSIQRHPHHDADILRDGSQASLRGKEDGDYTLEDYYSLPADISAELIDGHLIFMEAPSILHQDIIGELFYQIQSHIKKNKGPCKVILSPVDVRLDNDDKTILQPDLIVLCDQEKNNGKRINGAPDFIAEVVSAGSRKRDYLVKLNKYWIAGVKEYWIIDPGQRQISVYRFHSQEEDFIMETYNFQDEIPLGLYDNLLISFKELSL